MPRRKRGAVASRTNGKVAKSPKSPTSPTKSCFKRSGLVAVQYAHDCVVQERKKHLEKMHKTIAKWKELVGILKKMRPPKKKRSKLLRQRGINKAEAFSDKAEKMLSELYNLDERMGKYAYGWSDEKGALVVRSFKEQRKVMLWWRWARSIGYPRPSETYDDAVAMEQVKAAMAAEVAGCVEALIAGVVSACSAPPVPPKAKSPRTCRLSRLRHSSR